jgi:LacI family transcriptional regulator
VEVKSALILRFAKCANGFAEFTRIEHEQCEDSGMERITIEDVASRAGVSPTTVSHVFSGHRPVRQETKDQVERAAGELGYRPNAVARSLRVQRTSTAMIILPDITNPYYPVFARGVQDVLRGGDYHTLLCNTDSRESEERAFLDEAISRRLDGVIFTGYWVTPEELLEVAAAGVSVVNLGEGLGESEIDAVRSTDREGARDATAYLIERFGSSVALIDGTKPAPVARARTSGYRDAFRVAGVAVRPELEVSEDLTREGGRRGMANLLDLAEPPRAVFCANDLIAIGAIDEAKARGLAIPADIAVVGFDDIDAASMMQPKLTTVENFPYLLGTHCGELLLSRMTKAHTGAGREVVVPTSLIVRESA